MSGRTYSLVCADGEEARLIELSDHVRRRADALYEEFGQIGDDRILLLTAILIADELDRARHHAGTPAPPVRQGPIRLGTP